MVPLNQMVRRQCEVAREKYLTSPMEAPSAVDATYGRWLVPHFGAVAAMRLSVDMVNSAPHRRMWDLQ